MHYYARDTDKGAFLERSATARQVSLDVVIVNWNSSNQLGDCLRSLAAARRRQFVLSQVTVVDNASSDGSLERAMPVELPLQAIVNRGNDGFGLACNKGAAAGRADLVLFLNPDMKVFEDTLDRAVDRLLALEGQGVGLLGVQLLDEHGAVHRSCSRFPRPRYEWCRIVGLDRVLPRLGQVMREWDHRDSREVEHVTAAFLLLRRTLFESLGGFDTDFFMYLEDVDFSLRAASLGARSYFAADIRAFHRGGGTSIQIEGRRLFYSLLSRSTYAIKHFSRPAAFGVVAATLIEIVPRLLMTAVQRERPGTAGKIIAGYRMYATMLPHLLGCILGKRSAHSLAEPLRAARRQ